MIQATFNATGDRRLRRNILIASIAVPVLYALLGCVHWILEDYIREWSGHHGIYAVCKPIAFFMTLLVLVGALVVAVKAIVEHRQLGSLLLVLLCVLLALAPILFIISGISLFDQP